MQHKISGHKLPHESHYEQLNYYFEKNIPIHSSINLEYAIKIWRIPLIELLHNNLKSSIAEGEIFKLY